MSIRVSMIVLAAPALIAAIAGAGDAPPAVPRDTLPAELAIAEVPLGLDPRKVPADNALTDARVQLGRLLFFDPILSADKSVACASCHRPENGFASGPEGARGIRGERLRRRAPTLFNRAYGTAFFWDGRTDTLEAQALRPIEDSAEMGSKLPDVLGRLEKSQTYKDRFAAAFPDGVTATNLARALAGFERVLLRGNSGVDRFRRLGNRAALSSQELHGLWLYEGKGRCWRCHTGANFTDERFHNTGVSWGKAPLDLGRFDVSRIDGDRGKFKTPTLRGVVLTAPYMHDGSLATLEQVVEFYNQGGGANPHRDSALEPLGLTKDEMHDLVAFLKSL
jgi:cytochrome c peroxidase